MSLHTGKGDGAVCGNHKGISPLSAVGKVYSRIAIHRVKGTKEELLGEK